MNKHKSTNLLKLCLTVAAILCLLTAIAAATSSCGTDSDSGPSRISFNKKIQVITAKFPATMSLGTFVLYSS